MSKRYNNNNNVSKGNRKGNRFQKDNSASKGNRKGSKSRKKVFFNESNKQHQRKNKFEKFNKKSQQFKKNQIFLTEEEQLEKTIRQDKWDEMRNKRKKIIPSVESSNSVISDTIQKEAYKRPSIKSSFFSKKNLLERYSDDNLSVIGKWGKEKLNQFYSKEADSGFGGMLSKVGSSFKSFGEKIATKEESYATGGVTRGQAGKFKRAVGSVPKMIGNLLETSGENFTKRLGQDVAEGVSRQEYVVAKRMAQLESPLAAVKSVAKGAFKGASALFNTKIGKVILGASALLAAPAYGMLSKASEDIDEVNPYQGEVANTLVDSGAVGLMGLAKLSSLDRSSNMAGPDYVQAQNNSSRYNGIMNFNGQNSPSNYNSRPSGNLSLAMSKLRRGR